MPAFQSRISATSSFRDILAATAVALALLAPTHAKAQHSYEQSLMHMLPLFCRYTQDFMGRFPGTGDRAAEYERWKTSMGPTFIHMHHYCYGLMDVNRALLLSRTREDRLFNLNKSIAEFDYVIQRSTPDFSLLPEIHTKKGESLIQLDKADDAIFEFRRAIKIRADYTPPYAAMSDYYKGIGEIAKAREWLKNGLSAAPNAAALKRRLTALNKLPDKENKAP